MATTRDYLHYLNEKVDISPANSQEELDAAELLGSLMGEHGLDVEMQDFDAPAQGKLAHNILYVVMFLGMLLAGFAGTGVGTVGLILVLASFFFLAMEFYGHDLLGNLGPRARSQNVIGVHRATGPLVIKGNRPIVIVAHYDSPNEDLLSRPQFARYQPMLKRATFICSVIVPVCALVQVLGFVPAPARGIFWIVGILASLPLLAVGISAIYQRFAPCTLGANDNKASVAAMLGVMDKVRPHDDAAKRYAELHPQVEPEPADEEPEPMEGEGVVQTEPAAGEPVEPAASAETEAGLGSEPAAASEDELQEDRTVLRPLVPVEESGNEPEAYVEEAAAQEPIGEGSFGKKVAGFFHNIASAIEGRRSAAEDRTPAEAEEGPAPYETQQYGEYDEGDEGPADDGEDLESMPGTTYDEAESVHDVRVTTQAPLGMRPAAESGARGDQPASLFENNVRRGAEFVGSLNILPADCEIVYKDPPRPRPDLSDLPEIPEMPDFDLSEESELGEPEPTAAEATRAYRRPIPAEEAARPEAMDETEEANPYLAEEEGPVEFIHYVTYDEEYPIVEEYEVIEDAAPATGADEEPDGGVESTQGSEGASGEGQKTFSAEERHARLIDLPEIIPTYDTDDHAADVIYESDDATEAETTTAEEPMTESEADKAAASREIDLHVPEVMAEPEAESAPVTVPEAETAPESEPESEPVAEVVPEPEQGTESERVSEPEQVGEPEIETAPESETIVPKVESETEPEPVTEPTDGSDAGTLGYESHGEETLEEEKPAAEEEPATAVTMDVEAEAERNDDSEVAAQEEAIDVGTIGEGEAYESAPAPEPETYAEPVDAEYTVIPEAGPQESESQPEEARGFKAAWQRFKARFSRKNESDVAPEAQEHFATDEYEEIHAADRGASYSDDQHDEEIVVGQVAEESDADYASDDEDYEYSDGVGDTAKMPRIGDEVLRESFGETAPEAYPVDEDGRPEPETETEQERGSETEPEPEADDEHGSEPEPKSDVASDEDVPAPRYERIAEAIAYVRPKGRGVEEPDTEAAEPVEAVEQEVEPERPETDAQAVEKTVPSTEAEGTDAVEPEVPLDEPGTEPEGERAGEAPEGDSDASATTIMPGISFTENIEASDEDLAKKDISGLDAPVEDDRPAEKIPRPRPIDNPNWGKSEYTPPRTNIARRAVLFDLPDPAEATNDPFATGPHAPTPSNGFDVQPVPASASESMPMAPAPEPMETDSQEVDAKTGKSVSSTIPENVVAVDAERANGLPRGTREPLGTLNGTHTMETDVSRVTRAKAKRKGKKGPRKKFSIFGRKEIADQQPESMGEWLGVGDDYDAKKNGREIGSWENFNRGDEAPSGDSDGHRDGGWKGGATTRSGFRVVAGDGGADRAADDQPVEDVEPEFVQEGQATGYELGSDQGEEQMRYDDGGYVRSDDQVDPDEPTPEDLRASILGMGDDALISHDVYFVALGASSLDHAGMRNFLAEHRKDIRGAFLINLDCVGAGNLSFLTREGRTNTRRSDRRMSRMLINIAKDLHVPLAHYRYDWDETDGTPAMQDSVRVTTVMGVSDAGVPALSRTSEDLPENVDAAQVVDVAEMVAELIRRS